MKSITLIRKSVFGNSVFGRLYVYDEQDNLLFVCDTCENLYKVVPNNRYICVNNYSPKFQRILPLLENVPNRTGIRIHSGNTGYDSSGCILVGELASDKHSIINSRNTFNELFEYIKDENQYSLSIF